MNGAILGGIRSLAKSLSRKYSPDSFILRGLWKTDLLFRPNAAERTFKYTYVLAQTVGQGCCYSRRGGKARIDQSMIGTDARGHMGRGTETSIAILDAVYSAFRRRPARSFTIRGNPSVKSVLRARIVADEALRLHGRRRAPKILNIGVVGNIIRELSRRGAAVTATDYDRKIIGADIGKSHVHHGSRTLSLVPENDIAVITGMTIATDTLDSIVEAAQRAGTRTVMFCETGANFCHEYLRFGVDCAVAEIYPFYIYQGTSSLDVFRRK